MKGPGLQVVMWMVLSLWMGPASRAGELRTRPPDKAGEELVSQNLDSVLVNVEILDQFTVVTMVEIFEITPDTTTDSLLGAYTLSLPRGAIVSELAFWSDGEKKSETIVEKEEAAHLPEGVMIGEDETLFQEDNSSDGVFSIGVYPVNEVSNNRVEIVYFLALPKVGDVVTFELPSLDSSAVAVLKLTLRTQSAIESSETTDEIPVVNLSDTELRIDYTGSLSDFVFNYTLAEHLLFTALSYEAPDLLQDGYFISWTVPPDSWFDVEFPLKSRELVFCLDVSATMGEDLAPVRNTIETTIRQLRPSDRFDLITYSSTRDLLKEVLVPADSANMDDAVVFLRGLQPEAEDASDLLSALQVGLSLFGEGAAPDSVVRQLVLVSRAVPNSGSTTNREAIRQLVQAANNGDVQIYPVRIKTAADEGFFEALAGENNGELFAVMEDDDLGQQILQIIERITLPTLTGFEIADNSSLPNVRQVFQETYPELSKGQQIAGTGRYGPERSASFLVTASNGLAGLDTSEVIDFAAVPGSEFVSRYWASSKIASLRASERETIVELSRNFRVLSDFTAFPYVGEFEFYTGIRLHEQSGERGALVDRFKLYQNFPNPFNPRTTIEFEVGFDAPVTLKIYNMLGQLVMILVDEMKQQGTHSAKWNGRNSQGIRMPTGLYIYTLEVGNFRTSRKMMMVR